MMSNIHKRYAKALFSAVGSDDLQGVLEVLNRLRLCFAMDKFVEIINSPFVSKNQKEEFVISILESNDTRIINFIKILTQKNRLNEIPYIVDEIKRYVSSDDNEYELLIQSSFDLSTDDVENIKSTLSGKMNTSLCANSKHMDSEGIKLAVAGVNLEASLLKSTLSKDLKSHILKAF